MANFNGRRVYQESASDSSPDEVHKAIWPEPVAGDGQLIHLPLSLDHFCLSWLQNEAEPPECVRMIENISIRLTRLRDDGEEH